MTFSEGVLEGTKGRGRGMKRRRRRGGGREKREEWRQQGIGGERLG